MPNCDSVKEVRQTGSTTVVVLTGTIDLHHTPQVHKVLLNACERKPQRLVVNLEQVGYIDSSGIGVLVDVFRRLKAHDGKLALCCLNDRVHSVLEITKLDKFFEIHATEAEALAV